MRAAALVLTGILAMQIQATSRPRARELGIAPGVMEPGPLNAITDVAGVLVGQATIVQGNNIRTGVTAILPHGGNIFRDKVPGAVFVGNAFGKLAGSTQVDELGTIESPIVLTNTLSVGIAIDAIVRWTIAQSGSESVRSVNALVGETNDGTLNDIRGLHVTREHVTSAIARRESGCRRRRGGRCRHGNDCLWLERWNRYVVAEATAAKRHLDRRHTGPDELRRTTGHQRRADLETPVASTALGGRVPAADGSCMIVVATDAPLDARDLERLAARAIFALARTGSTYSNGSGDFAIAFSTHPSLRAAPASGAQTRSILPTDSVSLLFEATLDATEEAIYNSLLKAVETRGNGRTIHALPIEPLKDLFAKYGR